uniref:39S ribosomal protein L45, mitochondrial n=1 Tax=Serinus canaria TaxID=9135 RepID=A0A8C9N6Q2_SERCA
MDSPHCPSLPWEVTWIIQEPAPGWTVPIVPAFPPRKIHPSIFPHQPQPAASPAENPSFFWVGNPLNPIPWAGTPPTIPGHYKPHPSWGCFWIFWQTLAIYDRFGRLMYGGEEIPKDVLEYVVFERYLVNPYGTWRMHGKIIPEWAPPKDPIIKTVMIPDPAPDPSQEHETVK